MFKPVEIAGGIYSVGCQDWDIRDFHGYSTREGTSYNAFLVLGEQNILIDTVKSGFSDALISNITQIIDPSKIDAIISNHSEMDHSGAIPRVLHRIGEHKPVYCSKMGAKNLQSHFNRDYNYQVVGSGESLTLGNRTFMFLETRMLHWPDSMFTWLPDEKILFSSDAFGQHYAGDRMYDDDMQNEIMPHARKYYANILLHFSDRVQALLRDVARMNLDIRMICPDHGILWRKNPGLILEAYDRWSRQEPARKALVIYDSMWESTAKMARAIAAGIASEAVSVRLMNTRKWHRSDIMTEVLDAGALAVGSPTLNNGIFPVVADVMTYIKGLRPQNKLAAAFGSYGWSGEAVGILNREFEDMKLEIVHEGLKVQYVPDAADLARCEALGVSLASRLKEKPVTV